MAERPRVGWLCTYVPEELICAAGGDPVRVVAGSETNVPAPLYLPANVCSYVRACLALAADGPYRDLDAVVITNCCNATQRLYDVWATYLRRPVALFLDVPRYDATDAAALAFFRGRLARLGGQVAALAGATSTWAEDALAPAIAMVEAKRARLRAAAAATARGDLPAAELAALVRQAFAAPPAAFLAGPGGGSGPAATDVSASTGGAGSPAPAARRRGQTARLILSGGMADHAVILRLLDELGATVVYQDHCLGDRYWERVVDGAAAPGDAHPLTAVARAYLGGPHCPRMNAAPLRMNTLGRIAEKTRAHGIVHHCLQFCDTTLFEAPLLRDLARRLGMGMLALESDLLQGSGAGQLLTRLQAFVEACGGGDGASTAGAAATTTAAAAPAVPGAAPQVAASAPTAASSPFCRGIARVRAIQDHLPLEAIRRLVPHQIELFTRSIWVERQSYIWTSMVMPPEMFHAMGLLPVNSELIAGWHSSLGLSREALVRAEAEGFSVGLCSYHKTAIGALLDGWLPPPAACVVSSNICDGAMKMSEFVRERWRAEYFLLDLPHERSPDAEDYVVGQLKAMAGFLADVTGRRLDEGRLAEACRLSNAARESWLAAHRLRQDAVLMPGSLGMRNLFGTTFLFGSPAAVEVSGALYAELRMRREAGWAPKTPARCRLLWIHFAPLYRNSFLDYLENGLGAAIAVDITNHVWWDALDPQDPYRSLARKALGHYYLGGPAERVAVYQGLARRFGVDGAVHFLHAGCRAIPGAVHVVKDALAAVGVPLLELHGDCIDSRGFSDEQARTRLEAFIEMMGA